MAKIWSATSTLILFIVGLSWRAACCFAPRYMVNTFLSAPYKLSSQLNLFSVRSFDANGDSSNKPPSSFRMVRNNATASDATTLPPPQQQQQQEEEWKVYVDQSKVSLERGAAATLDAFVRLSPRNRVRVIPAVFTKPKVKGPIVRCIPTDSSKKDSLEVANVDSVDKVYRILTRHMRVSGVNAMARECLQYKFQGNSHLEENEPSRAIEAYDRALGTNFTEEQGIILLNRATAYLQMAAGHKKELQELVVDLAKSVPDLTTLQFLYEEAAMFPALSGSMFQRVVSDTKMQDRKFRKIKHRHGLYQYSLLHAAQDGLRATQLLPTYAKSWLRAGEILSELWKLNESAKYYEKAIELDSSLEGSLSPVVERLRKRQELLTSARAYGWSEDTLRLALDVAG